MSPELAEFVRGLGAGVDVRTLGFSFIQMQTPACHDELTPAVARINADDWDLIGRRCLVAARKVRLGQPLDVEEPLVLVTLDHVVEAPAHIARLHLVGPANLVDQKPDGVAFSKR